MQNSVNDICANPRHRPDAITFLPQIKQMFADFFCANPRYQREVKSNSPAD